MLQDGYVIESIEEDGFSNGATELLTIDEIKQVLEEVRARDVQIFSVSDRCEWTDTMVVATGISDRHVRGIADALVYKVISFYL
jgi:ribosomal silencing factor RsfS